jgi:hypothetical protein
MMNDLMKLAEQFIDCANKLIEKNEWLRGMIESKDAVNHDLKLILDWEREKNNEVWAVFWNSERGSNEKLIQLCDSLESGIELARNYSTLKVDAKLGIRVDQYESGDSYRPIIWTTLYPLPSGKSWPNAVIQRMKVIKDPTKLYKGSHQENLVEIKYEGCDDD